MEGNKAPIFTEGSISFFNQVEFCNIARVFTEGRILYFSHVGFKKYYLTEGGILFF